MIRVQNSETMDPWRLQHQWCTAGSETVGSLAACSPNLVYCLLLEGKAFMSVEHLLWCVPGWAPCMLPVLTSLWHMYPKAVIQEGLTLYWPQELWTEWNPCPRVGCGPFAPLQPCPHHSGCPFTISNNGFLQDSSFLLLPQWFSQAEHLTRTTGYHIC